MRHVGKVALASAVLGLGAFAAGAAPATANASSAATVTIVVKVANRPPFGNILTNTAGRSLYIHPSGPCNSSVPSCFPSTWPPLLMPTGTTTPGGAKCLTTAKFSTTTRLQVEYMKQRLYTFTADTGTSVKGNKLNGFLVAKVSTTCP